MGILGNDDEKNIILSEKYKDFITEIIDNMDIEDMFIKDDSEIIIKKNKIRKIKRNPKLIKTIIKESNYKCFFDSNHTTFKTEKYPNYMEGHHIIPISLKDSFEKELDCIENLIPLCPNCHKAIHLSVNDNKNCLIEKIINNSTKLKSFNIEKSDLQDIYFK